ncbi:MAG TPA: ion transporter [Solimonas sp.]
MTASTFLARLQRIRPIDWVMLALALLSIGLLAYETWGSTTPDLRRAIILADYAICLIFAVEFLWRWREHGWALGFAGRNWYEILGMIPVAHPALRAFRLIRFFVLLARLGRAADRALGDDFTYRLVNRFKDSIVRSISGAVTVAVLDEVGEVLGKGTYTQNISRALENNQREVRSMILEKLREDKQTGRLRRLPFYDDIVESVIDAGLRVVEQVLKDPRTDELVASMLRENIAQLRIAVQQHEAELEAARRGVTT